MKKKNTRSKCRPTTVIDAMLWEQFVETAAKRLGYKKGVIQTALQLALRKWISSTENGNQTTAPKKPGDDRGGSQREKKGGQIDE